MKVYRTRYNFATNSSSSHSLVRIPDEKDLTKYGDQLVMGDYYGWEFFSLISLEEKLRYVATAYQSSRATMSPEDSALYDSLPQPLTGIDHESVGLVGPSLKAALELVSDPRVAILGGNDNVSYKHPWVQYGHAEVI